MGGMAVLLEVDPSVHDADEVAALLGTDLHRGLPSAEAARRLETMGPNELRSAPPVPLWRRLLRQLRDPLVYLLLGAVVVSFAAWLAEGAEGVPFDAVVILVIVLANAVLGYVQERKAEDAVAALQRISAATAAVVRDGELRRVPAREVVPGDLLALAEGDTVAADARLVRAAALTVAEAALTGESEPVTKDAETLPGPAALADRVDMVFGGTAVTRGTGRAVVVATGMGGETGRIAQLLEETEQEPTPLTRELARVGRMLGIAVVVIAAVVVGTILLTSDLRSASDVVTVLLLGVSLAVAAVPEGLPAILSVVLAIGVQRMAARRAIVKNLSSVETLGSASVICSDKTGTLTQNAMTIETVVTASGRALFTGVGYDPSGTVEAGESILDRADTLWTEVAAVLSGGSLANDAVLRQDAAGTWEIEGDPTEAAFLVAERKLGTTLERTRRFRRVGTVPFSSERKLMSSLEVDAEQEDRLLVFTKGAPDVLLSRCTHRLVGQEVVPLDDEARAEVLHVVEELSDQALRTLGVAFRVTEHRVRSADEGRDADRGWESPDADVVERELVLAGVVGILDPPRPEARDAVTAAHRAGVRVIMITGDHPRTAARIAGDLGIVGTGASALAGTDLDRLDADGLRDAVREVSVFARVAPEHKLRIVDALQADGNVVAMTGDGVNDAPALKSADIGVAMGITGTEVTRQAGAMILADDNFATIVEAVREGRGIFDNIRKFLRYLLSSNMGEVLTVFAGVVLAGALGLSGHGEVVVVPLLATQILWINLLTDSGPALAMGVDPQTDDVMARPPRRLTDRVIDGRMWVGVISTGAVMAAVTLLTIDLNLPGGTIEGTGTLDSARTAGFTVLVLAQLFNALNARSETTSAFRHLLVNRWLWGALALSAVLQVAVVHVPLLNRAFGTVPLTGEQWLVCLAMASVVLWFSELRKLVERVSDRRG